MKIVEKNIGSTIHNVFIYNYMIGKDSQQHPILVTVVNGNPGRLYVYSLNDFTCKYSTQLENAQGAMNLDITDEGIIVIGTFDNGGIYLVDSVLKTVRKFESVIDDSFIYGLTADSSYIYGGGFPNCKLWRMAKSDHVIEPMIKVDEDEKYLRSIIKDGDTIYIGVGAHPRFYRFNTKDEELIEIIISEDIRDESGSVINLTDVGDHILGTIDGMNSVFIYTKESEKIEVYKNYHDFVYKENSIYMFNSENIDVLSLDDRTIVHYASNFAEKYRRVFLVTINNEDTFITITDDGYLLLYELTSKELFKRNLMMDGEETIIQTVKASPNGLIFLGGYQSGGLTVLDSESLEYDEYKEINQIEGMTFVKDRVFLGVYPGGHIYEYAYMNRFSTHRFKHLFKIGQDQDRPFAMESTDDKVFIGSVPVGGILGGALTVYSLKTLEKTTYRNIINNQSIVSLALHKERLYGSTSVWGGMGQEPIEKEAKIFSWDIYNNKLIDSFVPIPGEKAITDIQIDQEGYLWGLTRSILFKVDLSDNTIIERIVIEQPDWNVGHLWIEGKIIFITESQILVKVRKKVYLLNLHDRKIQLLLDDVDLIEKLQKKLYITRGRELYQVILKK